MKPFNINDAMVVRAKSVKTSIEKIGIYKAHIASSQVGYRIVITIMPSPFPKRFHSRIDLISIDGITVATASDTSLLVTEIQSKVINGITQINRLHQQDRIRRNTLKTIFISNCN
jgi:hypothetical protein